MDEKTVWIRTYSGKRGFWFTGVNLIVTLIVIIISFGYLSSIGRLEIAIGLTILPLVGVALGLRAVLFFWRNWCTHAAITEDNLLVRNKDGSIRKIRWKEVSRIKMLTKGMRLTGTVQSRIILHGEKYDNAVVTGDAAITLYEEWMRRKGGF